MKRKSGYMGGRKDEISVDVSNCIGHINVSLCLAMWGMLPFKLQTRGGDLAILLLRLLDNNSELTPTIYHRHTVDRLHLPNNLSSVQHTYIQLLKPDGTSQTLTAIKLNTRVLAYLHCAACALLKWRAISKT